MDLNQINDLVLAALAPTEGLLRAEYSRQLTASVDAVLAELAADGWDSHVRFSYPSGSLSRKAYIAAKHRHDLVMSYTSSTSITLSRFRPDIRVVRADKAERIEAVAAKAAKAAVEGFALKLAGKISATGIEVSSVEYVGGLDPWGWTHVCVNGRSQVWRTKMIINVSVLGKLFNQWPTRLVNSTVSE